MSFSDIIAEKKKKAYKERKKALLTGDSSDSNPVFTHEFDNIKLGKIVTPSYNLVDSRGELIISIILDELNIKYQTGVYLRKYSLNADFILLEQNLIIEYWGLNDMQYNDRREEKTTIYKENGFNLVHIEAEEVDNYNKLKDKLKQRIGCF